MTPLRDVSNPDASHQTLANEARSSNQLFVRSLHELAPYDAARGGGGHVLTVWEAIQAYGLEVVAESLEKGSAILPETQHAAESAIRLRMAELGVTAGTVSSASGVPREVLQHLDAEDRSLTRVQDYERVAVTLGLDERFIGIDRRSGGDAQLAARLRALRTGEPRRFEERGVLTFAEAAWIISAQLRLQSWLEVQPASRQFTPSSDYGSSVNPSWKVGYDLAHRARELLGMGNEPIASMRELVEQRLGIPVIQAQLPQWIAGATVAQGEQRGILLNLIGATENVWVRRATLAHELGHLLFDPTQQLEHVKVDSYEVDIADPAATTDFVEQRANAFGIAFLAPPEAVRALVQPPFGGESVVQVMRTFGIGPMAAGFHLYNANWRTHEVPTVRTPQWPEDEERAAEDFAIDYFLPSSTPYQRRGRFAALTAASVDNRLISEDTAALYLRATREDVRASLDFLRSIA